MYQPWAMSGLTHVFAGHTLAAETPAAYSIHWFDAFETLSQPFTQELPHAIMNIIAADPIRCGRVDIALRLERRCAASRTSVGSRSWRGIGVSRRHNHEAELAEGDSTT